MPTQGNTTKTVSAPEIGKAVPLPAPERPKKIEEPAEDEAQLFQLYEEVLRTHPGSRDAEIFEKIHEWIFSDFSIPAHEFAGITRAELMAWQKRNQINLSAGHIRPDPIDVQRGHAWGHIRMTSAANRLHSNAGPPSAEDLKASQSPFQNGSSEHGKEP